MASVKHTMTIRVYGRRRAALMLRALSFLARLGVPISAAFAARLSVGVMRFRAHG